MPQRGGRKKWTRGIMGRQLEATVHTSLPPRVQGSLRAYVRVCVSAISWEYSVSPPASKLCVGLRWWGEESPGTVFRVPVVHSARKCPVEESTTLAYFPVRSAMPQLLAYLHDMKALKLRVGLGHMTEDSMVIGRCTLPDLSVLSESQPYEEALPIIGTQGHRLGSLHVQVELQVARAGQTNLTAPAVSDGGPSPPEFKVGPGTQVREKQGEFVKQHRDQGHLAQDRDRGRLVQDRYRGKVEREISTKADWNTDYSEKSGRVDSAASHKAALLAKYINPRTEQKQSVVQQAANAGTASVVLSGDGTSGGPAAALGPRQQEVIAELIERGERLREAMVRAVLDSGKERKEEGEGERGKRDWVCGDVYSSSEEKYGDVSSEESHSPLRDPSLLNTLLYSGSQEAEKKIKDSGTQTATISPSPPPLPPSPSSQGQTRDSAGAGGGASLSSLASFFSGQSLHKATDDEILQAVGVERLTLLGRVTSCRVVVESLWVEPGQLAAVLAQSVKNRPSKPLPTTHCGTFFVEYHFPALVSTGGGRKGRGRGGRKRLFPPPHEVVRVASRKIKDKVVRFGHRSVFPVSLAGSGTRQWWHDHLTFTLYYRPPTDRAPFLLGKARVPFRQWLMGGSSSRVEVPVTTVAGKGGREVAGGTDERTLGKLTVSVELLCGKGEGKEKLSGSETAVRATRETERDTLSVADEETSRESEKKREKFTAAPPIKVMEPKTVSATDIDKQPRAIQLLLMIPEATELCLPPPSTPPAPPPGPTAAAREVAPNCYLVCRLFCANPHPRTPTVWASCSPHFNFKQVFPLYVTPSLLEQVCNNFTVVEVWHKTPGVNTDDELLGLVKLSLHQFYLAFSEESSTDLCLQAQLPVVAVDSYCPVISPFTGNEQGHLAVLLAMGSTQQVTEIQQQFATGSYQLHKPFTAAQPTHQPQAPIIQQSQIGRPNDLEQGSGTVNHTFTVMVSGVRGLSVFNNTVWGEADCFVQYHFPTLSDHYQRENTAGPEVSLQPVQTDLTLCVPNPTFSHDTRHSLPLPPDRLVQREVMRTIGSSGGVVFELWRRFYYPNIRDHLIAKAILPVAKLCALVTMQRMAGHNTQTFSLPMTLINKDTQGGSGGVLEVTVGYQALGRPQEQQQQPLADSDQTTHVNLTVEVVRATGLRDAAVLAAQENPVPLGFAAEVGVNCYARVSLPGLLEKEGRCTKTVMRSFSPEFSHSLDFALPLISQVPLAQRMTEGRAVVEVWHKVPRSESRAAPVSGAVFGRRLGPAFRDVCLGQAIVPLTQLIEKQSGVRGWLPLYPPSQNTDETAPDQIDNPSDPPYVGGIEISLSFSTDEDRQLVLSRALEVGWKPPPTAERGGATDVECGELVGEGGREGRERLLKDSKCRWKFSVKVTELVLPIEAVTISMSEDPAPYMYCFLRYRFFDSDVARTSPRALTYCCDSRACYHLNHHVSVTTTGSDDLEWYVREECLEVEVWSCPTSRHPERDGDPCSSGDTLLGTAFLSLQQLLSGDSVSGRYPMFRAGEVSLGNQLLTVEVQKTLEEHHQSTSDLQSTLLEILDSGGSSEVEFVPLKPVSGEGDGEREAGGGLVKGEEEEGEGEMFEEMFEARLVIHQALHLPMITNKSQDREWPPNVYVTLHPHPNVERIVTAVAVSSQNPHWNHHCLTHVPNLYLDHHCPGLELQVWSKPTVEDNQAVDHNGQLANHSGQAADHSGPEEDIYIGAVQVDLSTLAVGLPQISGWYNISDFGGQIQGQLKVTVVPIQGHNFQQKSSHTLPSSHVLLSTHSVASPQLSSVLLAGSSSSYLPVHQVPSFMEKSSSVLRRELRDNLNQLDQIRTSNTGAPELLSTHSVASPQLSSDLLAGSSSYLPVHPAPSFMEKSSSVLLRELRDNQLDQIRTSMKSNTALPTGGTVPSSGVSTTTQVSLSLEYSSSGPSLQQHTPHTVKELAESLEESGEEKEDTFSAVVIADTEPKACDDISPSVSSLGSYPTKPTEVDSKVSPATTVTAVDSFSRSLTPLPENIPSCHLVWPDRAHSTSDDTTDCSSMDVGVDDRPASVDSLSTVSAGGGGSNYQHSDISSSSEELEPRLTTGQQLNSVQKTSPGFSPTTNDAGEKDTERDGNDMEGRFEEEQLSSNSSNRDEIIATGTGSCVTQTIQCSGRTGVIDGEIDTQHSNPAPVSTGSEPQQQQQSPQVKTSSLTVPEVQLPNFFMPPQELEQAMRSLRASALSRPPPPGLFGSTPTYPQEVRDDTQDVAHRALSTQSSVRTLQDVDQFLRSRRHTSTAGGVSSDHNRCHTVSDKDTPLSILYCKANN